ncbi:bifunctional riboflavin kinase/FAD synthetase [Anabaena sp. FACHB-709]|nr:MULTISPECIES: bifunctional riboflavin kinase/FAD synthetase [Nostocaceae]MBD2266103.1 bifunctional riboflavin kinase/FAD synthetase [Anabaena sp. FACHB-709]MBD2275525.1 bifunctional riboflavin kinase/FAD synthetase [Nostoc sp. PCC 7120 = FACHB-418]MBD2286514.1 bifunctional riboflavin kinase/FAD synthetase [Anabaena cylindrica FACHB-170]HBW32059.1 bifunctional riboflavin kinase/FAD synthetase [Nostoc sp. UBA8866]MBD2174429.1 bifunctional riboflavin kinase/FAD synthetase [Anabaena cylindrica 
MLNLSQNGCSVWVASSTEMVLTPTAVALGKFDGVHLGHQRVIQPVLQSTRSAQTWGDALDSSAQSANPPAAPQERIYSTVVTFRPHPQEFFTGQARTWLTPLDEKVQQLRSLGVDQLVLLPFDKELTALSPEEFVEKILVQQLRCQRISVGQDFCFGKQRRGTAKDLQLIAAKYHIPVSIVPLQTSDGQFLEDGNCGSFESLEDAPISTSLIRQALETGDIKTANRFLGRPYILIGVVVEGEQLGRTIGFPTANLELPKDKFVPRQGVYAVRVKILGESADANIPLEILGVMNIGNRPTVNGTYSSVEVYLLDWSGDLYGKELAVQLVDFLRPEQKFPSLEALKAQIQQDCTVARQILSREN